MKKLLPLLFVLIATLAVDGQNCTQNLNRAEDEYVAGRLIGIPELILDCIQYKRFSNEEEVRARKLLTQVYIFTDQESKAEGALVGLLRKDPEHRLNAQVDPSELFFLYNQFRTKPIFRIGFRGGVNFSYLNVIQESGVHNTSTTPTFYNGRTTDGEETVSVVESNLVNGVLTDTTFTYRSISERGIGFWGEVLFEKHIKNGFEVALGAQFRMSRYNVDNYINLEGLGSSRTNQQIYLRAPLLARYTLGYQDRDRKLLPYVFVGASFDYLIDARYIKADRFGGIASAQSTGTDLIASNQVDQFNYSLVGGLGLKIRFKTHFFTVEGRYDNGRRNYINGQERLTNKASTFDSGYTEPDLSLDVMSFSIGYTRSIYSPKKLKEY